MKSLLLVFCISGVVAADDYGRGPDGDDVYSAARLVRSGLQQRPAHGP